MNKHLLGKRLSNLLLQGEEAKHFIPTIVDKDPLSYDLVFHIDEQVGYKFTVQFDDSTWYWHPFETETLPDMSSFLDDR